MGDVTPRSVVSVLGEAVVRLLALLVAVVAGLASLGFALVAGGFALRTFVNGWIPSRWFSDRLEDWVFGVGVQGDAGNYVGFITSAIPAAVLFSIAQWGLDRATVSSEKQSSKNQSSRSR